MADHCISPGALVRGSGNLGVKGEHFYRGLGEDDITTCVPKIEDAEADSYEVNWVSFQTDDILRRRL
jgi:hypothetical protein